MKTGADEDRWLFKDYFVALRHPEVRERLRELRAAREREVRGQELP